MRPSSLLAPSLGLSVGVALVLAACDPPVAVAGPRGQARSEAPEGFWDHWGDGQAELAGYRLSQRRYGELREGEAVLVVVTEDFTAGQRVKSDGGHDDEYPVLKLNEMRDFQTGIYDYNLMTSTFLPLDGRTARGVPTKLSFSMQEWCGTTFDQLVVDGDSLRRTGHSYFDGEADRDEVQELAADAVFADALPLLVRGLAGELVSAGESRTVTILPRLSEVRMAHIALEERSATLSRGGETRVVESVLGAVEAEDVVVRERGGLTTTYTVESASPHRLLGWEASDGERGVLTGLIRAPYWQLARNGLESRRADLGLPAARWP